MRAGGVSRALRELKLGDHLGDREVSDDDDARVRLIVCTVVGSSPCTTTSSLRRVLVQPSPFVSINGGWTSRTLCNVGLPLAS